MFFPKVKHTKQDILDYYRCVGKYLIPWIKGRALTIKRFPNGVTKQGFIQKSAPEHLPAFVKVLTISKKAGDCIKQINCQSLKTLEYLVQLGTISLHAPLSKASTIEKPDKVIFDLDPSGKNFDKVKLAAFELKRFLEDSLKLKPYVMLTGSKGAHVVVFIKPSLDFETVRAFAKDVACYHISKNPKLMTIEASKSKRRGKVYVDILRNSLAQTAIAPFSIRSRPNASIAVFVSWSEFSRCSVSDSYTVSTIKKYLSKNKTLCSNISHEAKNLASAIKRIEKLKKD